MSHSVLQVIDHTPVLIDDCGQYVEFTAVVDDIVETFAGSYDEPRQFGPAVCTGRILLADDDAPATRDDFIALAHNVDPWTPSLDLN